MNDIKIDRRNLLKSAALGTAAASMPLSAGAAFKPLADAIERHEFPLPDFESVIGETVKITDVFGHAHSAKITEVSELAQDCHSRPAYLRERASVVRFEVADVSAFSNEVYQVKHSKLGKMELLLSAVPNENGEVGLEAVFN